MPEVVRHVGAQVVCESVTARDGATSLFLFKVDINLLAVKKTEAEGDVCIQEIRVSKTDAEDTSER